MKKSSVLLLFTLLLFIAAALLLKFTATVPVSRQGDDIPCQIHKRPMPKGNDFSKILPKKLGDFERIIYHAPTSSTDGDATYRAGKQEILILFSLSDNLSDAAVIMETVYDEIKNEGGETRKISLKTNPAYILLINKRVAFFTWNRDKYTLSLQTKNKATLDQFMKDFPY